MTAPDQRIYLFDDFCLDVNQCELRRQGEIISLPPNKPFNERRCDLARKLSTQLRRFVAMNVRRILVA